MNGVTLSKSTVENSVWDRLKATVNGVTEAMKGRWRDAVADFTYEYHYRVPARENLAESTVGLHPAGYLFSEIDGRVLSLDEGSNHFIEDSGVLRRRREGDKGPAVEVRVLEDRLLLDSGRLAAESNERVVLGHEGFRLKLLPPAYRALLRSEKGRSN